MKKRKELDALVPNGKLCKRVKKTTSFGSASAHELLANFSDTSDIEDFPALHSQRVGCRKGSPLAACLPLCLFILVSTSVVTAGTLIWLHLGLRQDLDLLRNHLQKVEAGNKNTPEALHSIHSHLKKIEKNVSILGTDFKKIVNDISSLEKQVEQLKQTTNSLKESIAAAPEIKELPKDVSSLSENVASFGSRITAMEATVKDVKSQQSSIQSSQGGITQTISNLEAQFQDLSNKTEKLSHPADKLQTTKLMEGQQILRDELLRVADAVDILNDTTLPVVLKVNEALPLLENINGNTSWTVEDLSKSHSEIKKLKDYIYNNITGQILVLASKQRTIEITLEQLRVPQLDQNVIQHIVKVSVDQAVGDMLNNTLSVGASSNTNVTFLEMLKQAQDMVHMYLELIQQLKGPMDSQQLIQYGNATDIVDHLLNLTLSSLLQDHKEELKILQDSCDHLLTQYSQLETAQAATDHKADTALQKLHYLENLQRINQNLKEITTSSSHMTSLTSEEIQGSRKTDAQTKPTEKRTSK
ncbi:uncharacterized protein LOC106469346 isoform X2 [Limulus polyphemus]|uniref:Uncharacterized protein LOC106469346 isoform X2 n=1 Tax=Limulus polyphemus TaxID=6850 RepID=A0ABM1TCE6_LIMPO|nr:uncharacterized protein LOC106469346 isoform X2 [Limulus polyphemus]